MVLAIGFDPAFIDTLVALKIDGRLVDRLPQPGHHFRDANISRIAGGNGVNISYILNKLDIKHKLIVPVNNLFMELLKERGIKSSQTVAIDAEIGDTVGISWKSGEIQLNDPRSVLGLNQWTKEINKYWTSSPIKLFINWGLNSSILEWASIQWLSCSGWKLEEIKEENNHYLQALEVQQNDSLLLLEPGSIKKNKDKDKLVQLLDHMAKTNYNPLSILCANEEEKEDFKTIKFQNKIIHTSKVVVHYKKDDALIIDVPPLKLDPKTFVGAGDSFIAGIIQSLLGGSIDINNGIKIAQNFLTSKL